MIRHHGASVYRGLVLLYPEAFRRRFADELVADFEDGALEASTGGALVFARWWAGVARDFLVSLGREWLRTPWVPALTIAAAFSFSLFSYAGYKLRLLPRLASWQVASGTDAGHDDQQLILVLVFAAFVPILGTILGSLWVQLLLRRTSGDRGRRRA